MLSLPWKPTRRLKISEIGNGRYLITIVSGAVKENAFRTIVDDQLASCLNEGDRLLNADWETKSVELITSDLNSFRNRIVFESFVFAND